VGAVEGLRSDDSAQRFIFDNLSEVLPPSGLWCHRHLRPQELCAPIWTSAYGALASLWYRPHNIRSSQKSSRWMTTYHETRHEIIRLSLYIISHTSLSFLSPFVPLSFISGHRRDSSGSSQGSLDFISMARRLGAGNWIRPRLSSSTFSQISSCQL